MKSVLFVLAVCLAVSGTAFAADKAKSEKKTAISASASSNNNVDIKNGTDVIGSQDAPMVLNIVPWKDKDNYLPKNPLTASVLQETLEPIDRDVVHREVDFSRALQETPAQATTTP